MRRPSSKQQAAEQQRRIDDLLAQLHTLRTELAQTRGLLDQAKTHGRVLADGLRNALDAVNALRLTVLSFKSTPDPAGPWTPR